MSKIKIYIIASVSSLFIGVSVGMIVSESPTISGWAIVMGIFAAAGGMAIELTVPETLITVWSKSGPVYKTLAVIATIASPALLIWALPSHGIARFSIAFITASLITYISFYATERIKTDSAAEHKATDRTNAIKLQAELKANELRLKAELEQSAEQMRLREERRTAKALAKIQQKETLPDTRENVINVIEQHPGISKRGLGRIFDRAPQTVLKQVDDLIKEQVITVNGDGVRFVK